jgi:hypothetical protein
MTFITHGFRVSVVSDVRERVRDFRITVALSETSDIKTFLSIYYPLIILKTWHKPSTLICELKRALYGIKCVLRIFANKMTFITHGFRVSVVSDVRERVRDFRITVALYVKKIFIS